MSSKSKVYFFFEKRGVTLNDRSQLKAFIEFIFKSEKTELESINYIFCSDERLLEINKRFLKHNFYTDIISFDLSENSGVCAEVYISADRVKENAKSLNTSFKSELHRVIFHGVLHLCGYSDKTRAEKKRIRIKEDLYLRKYQG
ncbi:MAG: rRNA maturation RNase YbeY [Sphingobacteriales bacterium]|nr:rRNA maturation RNase YbeY [Sphingobacteriales bacterium]